jgi:hypothetical protein
MVVRYTSHSRRSARFKTRDQPASGPAPPRKRPHPVREVRVPDLYTVTRRERAASGRESVSPAEGLQQQRLRRPLNSTWLGEQNASLTAHLRTDAKAVQQSFRLPSRTRKSLRKSRLETSRLETFRRLWVVAFYLLRFAVSAWDIRVREVGRWSVCLSWRSD